MVATGQGILGNNMFAYCLNTPVNCSDSTGCLPIRNVMLQSNDGGGARSTAGSTLSHSGQINDLFVTLGTALSNSCSVTVEYGAGFGAKGTLKGVSVEAVAIIAADEKTFYFNGNTETSRKSALTVQASALEELTLGLELEHSASIKEAQRSGIMRAKDAEDRIVAGIFFNDFGIGYTNKPSKNMEISYGFSGYFFGGGGIVFTFDIDRFLTTWEK